MRRLPRRDPTAARAGQGPRVRSPGPQRWRRQERAYRAGPEILPDLRLEAGRRHSHTSARPRPAVPSNPSSGNKANTSAAPASANPARLLVEYATQEWLPATAFPDGRDWTQARRSAVGGCNACAHRASRHPGRDRAGQKLTLLLEHGTVSSSHRFCPTRSTCFSRTQRLRNPIKLGPGSLPARRSPTGLEASVAPGCCGRGPRRFVHRLRSASGRWQCTRLRWRR